MSAVQLPDELIDRLAVEAARRGVTVDALAAAALEDRFPDDRPKNGARRHLELVAIGASDQSLGAAQSDQILAEGFGRN